MTDGQLASCHPGRLVPILALAGTNERIQPYEGWLYESLGLRLASVPETMEFWRASTPAPARASRPISHHDNTGPTLVAVITWTGCTELLPVWRTPKLGCLG